MWTPPISSDGTGLCESLNERNEEGADGKASCRICREIMKYSPTVSKIISALIYAIAPPAVWASALGQTNPQVPLSPAHNP